VEVRLPQLFPRIYYGWVIVAVAFLAALTTAGVRSAPQLFIIPFEQEFGWSRAAIAGAIGLNLLLFGLGAPISGRLIDRFGPRVILCSNLVLLTIGLIATTQMTELWQLNILWGVIIGMAAGGGGVLAATVSSRWFVERRGLVTGFLGTATSTGQLIFIPLLMFLVVAGGWRMASLVMVAVCLIIAIPILLFMRNDPSDVGLKALGADAAHAQPGRAGRPTDGPNLSLLEALRTREFWLLAGTFAVCGATANGLIGTHFIPHSHDNHVPEMAAATTVALMGGMNFVGTMASGWLTDRYDPRRLLSIYFALRGVSLFILPFVTTFPGLAIFAVIYGLDWFATVPATVSITAQRFGRGSMGSIYGWLFFAHQVGAAWSAFVGGQMRSQLGDYGPAFIMGGVFCMGAATLAMFLRLRPAAPTPAVVVPAGA
jgi:MFS family permease